MVMPFTEMGILKGIQGIWGEDRGKTEGNHELEFGSVEMDAFATSKYRCRVCSWMH